MVRRACFALIAILLAVVIISPGGGRIKQASSEELRAALSANEQRVVDLVNAERAKTGLPSLTVSAELTNSARAYASYMASANFFAHVGPDGSTLATRDQAAGYTGWTFLGENLAAGQSTAESAMSGWMASPTHRANILSASPREIGVGFVTGGSYGYYWVQEFGTRPSLTARAPVTFSQNVASSSWTSQVTGHTVSASWLTAYKAMGGLDVMGQPRSGTVADPMTGGRTSQYFQRTVLEYHPENPDPFKIQRRLLGDILRPGSDAPLTPGESPPGPSTYFPFNPGTPTGLGHFVANYARGGQPLFFKDFFDAHGAVNTFGFPKEEPKLRDGLWTQRFQAAVFQYHREYDVDGVLPGSSVPYRAYRVQLELLGDEYIAANRLTYD